MRLAFTIDARQKCIFVHLSGTIADWALGTLAQEVWEHNDFDPTFARMYDALEISSWQTDPSLLHAIGGDVRVREPKSVALIARSEAVVTGFSLIFDSLRGTPSRVFDDLHEAASWLGVTLPDPWPPNIEG